MKYPNIRAEMARRDMSQDQLAEHLHVCRKTLYNWQHVGQIPQKKLEAMADLFGVTVDYLLGRDEGRS